MCGRCKVIVKKGKYDTEYSGRILEKERKKGYVLACRTIPQSDLEVLIPEESRLGDIEILTEETKANSTEKKEEPSPATEETEKPSPTTGPDPGFSPLFEKIVDDLTSATQRSRETILKEIEKIKAENPALQPEVCALVHARKHNALKRELVDEVFRELVENFGS